MPCWGSQHVNITTDCKEIPPNTIIDVSHLWVCRSFVRDHRITTLRTLSLNPDPKGKVYVFFCFFCPHSQPSQPFCNLLWHGFDPFPQRLQPIISVVWWSQQGRLFRCDLVYIRLTAWLLSYEKVKKNGKVTLCWASSRWWLLQLQCFHIITSMELVAAVSSISKKTVHNMWYINV